MAEIDRKRPSTFPQKIVGKTSNNFRKKKIFPSSLKNWSRNEGYDGIPVEEEILLPSSMITLPFGGKNAVPFSGLLSCAGNERESEKKRKEKRSFPFMGERNSRRRKKYYFPIRRRRLGIPTLCTHSGEHCSCQKKFVVLRRRYMAFPKLERFFSPFRKCGRGTLRSLLPLYCLQSCQ